MQIDSSLLPLANTPLALNQAILAAYKQMVASYQPKFTNAVIVMTAGVGLAPGDLPTASLVSQLRQLYNSAKPVELIIVVLGTKANFTALQQIATGRRRRRLPGHQPGSDRPGVLPGRLTPDLPDRVRRPVITWQAVSPPPPKTNHVPCQFL